MTYNHDKAKVTCPECATEVERLREIIERMAQAMQDYGNDLLVQAYDKAEEAKSKAD